MKHSQIHKNKLPKGSIHELVVSHLQKIFTRYRYKCLGRSFLQLEPFQQVSQQGSQWLATGPRPQFTLYPEATWEKLAGWYWLDISLTAETPIAIRLLFELQTESTRSLYLDCGISTGGTKRIPLFVSPHYRSVRLETGPTENCFALSLRPLIHLRKAPELTKCFFEQKKTYEQLGWRKGNGAVLTPEHGIHPVYAKEYTWKVLPKQKARFRIEHLSLKKQWYMVEMRLKTDLPQGNAAFLFEENSGKTNQLKVPFHSGMTMKRLCKLNFLPRNRYFIPLEQAGLFSVERLHLEPVPALFAYHRMLLRLRNCISRYRGATLLTICGNLLKQACSMGYNPVLLLQQQYNLTFPTQHERGTYKHWIASTEHFEYADQYTIHRNQKRFHYSPTISVILLIKSDNRKRLTRAIESVRRQSYPHWKLFPVAADKISSFQQHIVQEFSQRDSRVLGGEAGLFPPDELTPEKLRLNGEWMLKLDSDDVLAPHAFHFIVKELQHNMDVQVIYSDEDSIDDKGQRSTPLFKPDWNPDLFLTHNYIGRLCAYNYRLQNCVKDDYSELLYCLPKLSATEIQHIPKILYHRSTANTSESPEILSPDSDKERDNQALEHYFQAQGIKNVFIEPGTMPQSQRVRYTIPQPPPLVSLIIPTRDMLEVLAPCLRSILDKTLYSYYEIIIVDNGSTDPTTLAYLDNIRRIDQRVKILPYPFPFNYSAINNFAVTRSKGEIIALVNNDIEVISPNWLTEMVSHALRPDIGCVGAKLLYSDGTIQHGGVILGLGGVAGHAHRNFAQTDAGYCNRLQLVHNLSAVTAACLVVRRSVFDQVEGLDEEHLQVAFNDVDFCIKVREAGYRNLWTPYAELFHHESKSRGQDDTPEKQERFQREFKYMQKKWGKFLIQDPNYNPNLTSSSEDFSIG